MEKLWKGRTAGVLDKTADEFNSSIAVDGVMFKEDILGSIAHAEMLKKQNIISASDAEKIIDGLKTILSEIESGKLAVDLEAEDIHMFVEKVLTDKIGEAGKRLHTARSRNDQVATDVRLYLRTQIDLIIDLLLDLMDAIACQAKANIKAIMPGYTHLQRAQPILFSHQILAYAMMLSRDVTRLQDTKKRMNVSPIGSCALAGTTYNTDREYEAKLLGFDGITLNSIDGVSDRDFCVELLSDLSLVMMHLSRFSEELILWSSWEFGFIRLDDAYTTGSSIMPQKKNPDMAELVRGKTGAVYGNLFTLLTMLKGLPLAYNKDMQEDKKATFEAVETVKSCLKVFAPMVKTMKVNAENMYIAAQKGFINATDLADYLTKKGMPFREAYGLVGKMVDNCIKAGEVLEALDLKTLKKYSDLFEADVYEWIDLKTCVEKRISAGGTGEDSVKKQISFVKGFIKRKK